MQKRPKIQHKQTLQHNNGHAISKKRNVPTQTNQKKTRWHWQLCMYLCTHQYNGLQQIGLQQICSKVLVGHLLTQTLRVLLLLRRGGLDGALNVGTITTNKDKKSLDDPSLPLYAPEALSGSFSSTGDDCKKTFPFAPVRFCTLLVQDFQHCECLLDCTQTFFCFCECQYRS